MKEWQKFQGGWRRSYVWDSWREFPSSEGLEVTREQPHCVLRKRDNQRQQPCSLLPCIMDGIQSSVCFQDAGGRGEVLRPCAFPGVSVSKKKSSCGSGHLVRRPDLNTGIWRASRSHGEVKLAQSRQRTQIKKKIGHGFHQPQTWAADTSWMPSVWAGWWTSLQRARESRGWHKHPCVRQ